jgi:hypothetical protein
MSRRSSRPTAVLAPGASSGAGARLPGRDEDAPRVDERIVVPETRAEIVQGQLVWAAPADPPHATAHSDLAYVLHAHVAAGYKTAVDMLTRTSRENDFAPDASVFAAEPDPATGARRLEELAFEVTSEQALAVPTEKARELARRGVRRVFAVLVKQGRALEWSRPTDGWSTLPDDATIDDACFVRPLPVRALLDAAVQDDAVAGALLARGNSVIEAALGKREASGNLDATRDAVIAVMVARWGAVPEEVRARVAGCRDRAIMHRWLARAATLASARDAIDE